MKCLLRCSFRELLRRARCVGRSWKRRDRRCQTGCVEATQQVEELEYQRKANKRSEGEEKLSPGRPQGMSLRISHRQIGIIVVLQVGGRCRHGNVVTVLPHAWLRCPAHSGRSSVSRWVVYRSLQGSWTSTREVNERGHTGKGPQP